MSDERHDSIDTGLNVMTGRRNVLKGASGLALGSLGLRGHSAATAAQRGAPGPGRHPGRHAGRGRQPAEHPLHHGR